MNIIELTWEDIMARIEYVKKKNKIKPNTKKQIILTFDDGYKDIISIVLQYLKNIILKQFVS